MRPAGWAREVEARAGEDGVEDVAATTGRWKTDLERFHHDGMATEGGDDGTLAVRVGLMASEAEEGVHSRGDDDDDDLLHLVRGVF